jgi:hypothetical protein
MSASLASSNLFISSWLKKFASPAVSNGIRVVEELFEGKIDQPFERGIADAMKVRHIAQKYLLQKPDIRLPVSRLHHNGQVGVVVEESLLPGPTVLCTGYRAASLVPSLKIDVKVGHCYLFRGRLPAGASTLNLASPYTHQKLYQYDEDLIYFADSVAVSLETYQRRAEELKERTLNRAQRLLPEGEHPIVIHRVGYRPFIKGFDFGFLKQVMRDVWVVNSGGKNGIIAYAHLADQLARELQKDKPELFVR